ncbi:MAG: hypothetical protein ACRD1Y_01785 [Terriglobales bacterium]
MPAATQAHAQTPAQRLFPSPSADWLYTAPTGSPVNISSMTEGMQFSVNAHSGGYDYPVTYTDGSLGCTPFTDTLVYNYSDHICVPNPPGGYHASWGGWGFDDGHLVVVDTSTGQYYDFWKLYTDANGNPESTNVGRIVEGSLQGDGNPGTTAGDLTGLAGDIMPGELDCATCLNHALSVVVPGAMNGNVVGHQGPVDKTDGNVPGGIFREGAKIRFDPSVDVNSLPVSTAVKAVLRALQLYGGLIVDQTGGNSIGFNSSLTTDPDLTGLHTIGQHLWIYY